MINSRYQILLFALSLMITPEIIFSQDAAEILKNMDNLMTAPKDKQATVKIILTNKSGKQKVREAEMKQKGKDKRLYRYTQPESQKGIATLSLSDGIMWLYMPAFGKPKKISLLSKSQAFTGTDFSYEDMETKTYSERYAPVFIESANSYYFLELIPKSEKSKYSKILIKVDKTEYYPQVMEYFDKGGRKFKEAVYEYKKKDTFWYAEEVVMTDLKKNHSTRIVMRDVRFNQGLTDDDFLVEKMIINKDDVD